jgi:hypothetical protein
MIFYMNKFYLLVWVECPEDRTSPERRAWQALADSRTTQKIDSIGGRKLSLNSWLIPLNEDMTPLWLLLAEIRNEYQLDQKTRLVKDLA